MATTATKPAPLATIDREATARQLTQLVTEYGPTALAKLDHFARAFKLADAVQKFRFVVRSAMPVIKPLQGSALGFLTDRDKSGGYDELTIEEAATEALMRGLTLDGNQWNIISGRCYVTKNGMAVMVKKLPGLTDLKLEPGIPQFAGIGAVMDYAATWNMDGKPQRLLRKIVCKCRPGEVDAALGKATRKMLAAVYEMVTGSEVGEEGEEVPPPAKGVLPAAAADIDAGFAQCRTLDELGILWSSLSKADKATHLAAKDKRKAELSSEPAPVHPSMTAAAEGCKVCGREWSDCICVEGEVKDADVSS